jgi:glycosyltransferase involved in cell wall biosynthesis
VDTVNPLATPFDTPPLGVTSGQYLYIGGSDIFNPFNQPAQHLPLHWAKHIEQLDLVGYTRFYDGPPASRFLRLRKGIKNILQKQSRVIITHEGTTRRIAARRLRLPGLTDPLVQDLWIYTILRRYLAPHYDVGIVYDPESALLARWLKRSQRVGLLVYHDIDYYPYVRSHWKKIIAWRERMVVRDSDAVISVSRPLVKLRMEQGAKQVLYLPNGVNFEQFNEANRYREEGGIRPPTLLYSGTLDLRWGVDLPLQAMPSLLLQVPDACLLIAGTGPAEGELKALSQSLGLGKSVQFLGMIPYKDLPQVMARADVGLATSREDIFRQFASPLKVVEYMAAGLPVICSGGGEAELMINESGGGKNIPFLPKAFTQAAQSLLTRQDELAACRRAAIAYAHSRSWQRLGKQLAEFLLQLTDQAARPQIEP